MTRMTEERLAEFIESQDFYELMQVYRHAPLSDQAKICEAFEAVKSSVKDRLRTPPATGGERPPIEEIAQPFRAYAADEGEVDDILTVCDYCLHLEALLRERDGQIEVGLQMSGSFFEALKPLGLTEINVANPGQHVTDLIAQLAARDAEIIELKDRINAPCKGCGA